MFLVYNAVFPGRLIITSYKIIISSYMSVSVPLFLNNSGHRNQIRGGETMGVAMGGE